MKVNTASAWEERALLYNTREMLPHETRFGSSLVRHTRKCVQNKICIAVWQAMVGLLLFKRGRAFGFLFTWHAGELRQLWRRHLDAAFGKSA